MHFNINFYVVFLKNYGSTLRNTIFTNKRLICKQIDVAYKRCATPKNNLYGTLMFHLSFGAEKLSPRIYKIKVHHLYQILLQFLEFDFSQIRVRSCTFANITVRDIFIFKG